MPFGTLGTVPDDDTEHTSCEVLSVQGLGSTEPSLVVAACTCWMQRSAAVSVLWQAKGWISVYMWDLH